MFTKNELNAAADAITRIAREQCKDEAVIRREMMEAIRAGLSNPDPEVRKKWEGFEYRGSEPTPEEFVAWSIQLLKEQLRRSNYERIDFRETERDRAKS